ncbi:glycosyltransferase family 4 protein, partial [Patescibacteria group bacterium]|nr:glycosyltransferase family 4 protein [Patescibacteria group bacterium]
LDAYLEKLLPYQKPSLKDKLLNWLANQIILFIQKIHFKLANQTIAISQYTSQEAQNLYNRTIPHIYLGSNFPTDLLKAKSLPRTVPKGLIRGCQLKAINILSISRFTPYKGFHHLIKTFNELSKQHRNLKLILAGSLGSQKYLDYLKEIANDKVSFIVNCEDEKLAQLYQASDIYATCDRYLFFGMPILEAASFSKPLLALNFCAANEVVQHKETGFVANNLREFDSYLEKLIQNQKLRDALGKNAQKRTLHEFTWGKTAEKYQEVFESL